MMDIPEKYKLCTADECRNLDQFTIDEFGVPSYTLMEIAGSKTAEHLLDEVPYRSEALIFCGKGNNAGDALVVARHLHRNGISSVIIFISGTENLSEDAQKNFDLLKKLSEALSKNDPELIFIENWDSFSGSADQYDFIIDGMLGTGLNSEVRGKYVKAIKWINTSGLPVYAIDIPTGLNADSGEIMGYSVKAGKTYTYGALKTGFYFNDGPENAGNIVLCDLGFPKSISRGMHNYLIDQDWIDIQDKPQHTPRHKYEAGVLFVIAGSEGLTGAAMLAARSAWAEGLGAVIMIVPKGILPVFENNMLQQVKQPVGARDDMWFKEEHVEEVRNILKSKKGTILLGPGLGRNEETINFVKQLLSSDPGNMVIDADGLWCLSQLDEIPKHETSKWILTPHPGELGMLTGSNKTDSYDRLKMSREYSKQNEVTLVSKGMPAIVSEPGGQCYITNYDTTVFARAGFGDILSGKVAAYVTLGYYPAHSAVSALLNGKVKYDQLLQNNHYRHPEPADLI